MRCDNCEYRRYIYSDDIHECEFGFEGENSKGECGCRYNRKTLNKFKRENEEELIYLDKPTKEELDEIYKEESKWYIDYCTSLFNGS